MVPQTEERGMTEYAHPRRLHTRPLAAPHQLGPWQDLFTENGYAPVAPPWPGEEATVAATRANPEPWPGTAWARSPTTTPT